MGVVAPPGSDPVRIAQYLSDIGDPATVEDRTAYGIWVVDPNRTDAELALVMADYRDTYIPTGVRTHLQHLREYLAKDPASITNAESVHVIKDLIRAVHYLNQRFETEG